MLVNIIESDYAPGFIQVFPKSERRLRKILDEVVANGGPAHRTALVNWEEIEVLGLTGLQRRDLESGWDLCVRMDDWLVRQLYGYV